MPVGSVVAKVEGRLRQQYGSNDSAVYGTLNKAGLMRGNKVTKKGRRSSKPKSRKAVITPSTLMSRMASV